jgi:hypothetical protein
MAIESHNGTPDKTLTMDICAPARQGLLLTALLFWYASSLLVLLSACYGFERTSLEAVHPSSVTRVDLLSSFASWDGVWYVTIASNGYDWDTDQLSSVAYFPAYPALATVVRMLTGCRTECALVIVSHGALLGCFVLLANYIRERFPAASVDLPEYSLLALGLFPTTFWMRMCYTESLFLFTVLLSMLGMLRGWKPFWIAGVIGFATATRSSGVALVPVFWWWMWRERLVVSCSAKTPACAERKATVLAMLQSLLYLPVCIWGLLAYMLFLYLSFGEPLAFMQTQSHWDERTMTFGEKLLKLATLEPFWAVYVPSSPCYWGRVPPKENPLFNLKFWNPIYVLITIGLLTVGARKKWLNARELLLAAGLLAIPLWFQATRACMMSQARYASVIFPVYIVMGQILCRLPGPLAGMLCAISGVMLAVYSALFVSWYWFY